MLINRLALWCIRAVQVLLANHSISITIENRVEHTILTDTSHTEIKVRGGSNWRTISYVTCPIIQIGIHVIASTL